MLEMDPTVCPTTTKSMFIKPNYYLIDLAFCSYALCTYNDAVDGEN